MQAWSNGNFARTLRPSIRVFCLWRWANEDSSKAKPFMANMYTSLQWSPYAACNYKIFTYIYHVISQMQVNIPYMEHLGMYVYVADYSYILFHGEAKRVLFLVPVDCWKLAHFHWRFPSWKWIVVSWFHSHGLFVLHFLLSRLFQPNICTATLILIKAY